MNQWRYTNLTQNGINLTELGVEIADLNAEIKRLETQKDEKRKEFFAAANESYVDKEYLLPTTTLSVPLGIFIYIVETEFLKTRFPSWEVIAQEDKPFQRDYVLRKRPEYMPFSYQDEDVSISRSPSEGTPVVDWDHLKEYAPNIFEKLAKPVLSYELNEEALGELFNESPTIATVVTKYFTVHKAPVLRVLAKKNEQ
jgi:hypothetical protein